MLPFYEYSTGEFQISVGNELNFPPHIHSATEIIYVRSGEITVQHGTDIYPLKGGEIMVFFPNEVHSYSTSHVDGTDFSMFIYRSRLCEEIEKVLATKIPQNYILKANEIPEEVLRIMELLEKSQESGEPKLVIKLYFELMCARLFPLLNLKKREDASSADLLSSVLSYISENYTDPVSLESLAKRFGVSRYKISRLFTHSIKVGLNDYVNTMRIGQAKSLLQNPQTNVIDVAFACGFESQQTFNRVFKEICGATPKEFRREINV